jgi:hypothetical protein
VLAQLCGKELICIRLDQVGEIERTMALRPSLLTKGLPTASGPSDTGSPAEQRGDAKKNMLKAMRAMPTQHYWNVYFDRSAPAFRGILAQTDRSIDSRKISLNPQTEPILRRLSNLARRLNLFKTFGDITIIRRWIRSRCVNQYTCSNKASSQYGRIGGISMAAVGLLGSRKLMDQISGQGSS